MSRLAAFLRGMNLGRRRISNADLAAHVVALGFTDVATFRASGNVILTDPDGAPIADAARRLEEGLSAALAYDVPVFARGAQQMRAMAAADPFTDAQLKASTGKSQVILLHDAPGSRARRAALALLPDDDCFAFEDAALHWLPRAGLNETELDFKALARAVGPTTVRTKGTIELIAARWFT